MIIPASGNSFNQILAEAPERAKKEEKKPEKEIMTEIVRIVGEYIAGHADELYAVEYTDLMGDDIQIHLKRRGETPHL